MADLQYQNPAVSNVVAVLDSEIISPTSVSIVGAPTQREMVVPQESISGADPLSRLCDLTEQMLDELKKIRVLLEQDVPPELPDDVLDEAQDSSGTAEENWGSEGIEEM